MRATELLKGCTQEQRRQIAGLLNADDSTIEVLVQTMRSPRVREAALAMCTSPRLVEDLWLVAANPFDPIRDDELHNASLFADIGLIARDSRPGRWRANLDFALTLVRESPVEFGFCATLLARLPSQELVTVARAMEIGPRGSIVDYLLEITAACIDRQRLNDHVAHLRKSQREVIDDALRLGELPNHLDDVSPATPLPTVTLDEGPAGQRGLVFRFVQRGRGIHERPVVPLESMKSLRELLDSVPAPPEAPAARRVSQRKRPTPVRDAGGSERERLASTMTDSLRTDSVRAESLRSEPARSATRSSTYGDEAAPRTSPRATAPSSTSFTSNTPTGDRPAWPGFAGLSGLPSLNVAAANAAVQQSKSGRSTGSNKRRSDDRPALSQSSSQRLTRGIQGAPASGLVDLELAKFTEAVRNDDEFNADIVEIIGDNLVVLAPGVDVQDWVERVAEKLGFR